MALGVRIVAFTHQGAVREHNEDALCVGAWVRFDPMTQPRDTRHQLEPPFPALICDGMGGHEAGEVASALVARELSQALAKPADETTVSQALVTANRAVFAAADAGDGKRGMGTTVAGLWFSAERLIWFNIGDSRVYRFRDGVARQLSIDDVRGDKDAGTAGGGITQALGGAQSFIEVEPHVGEEPLVLGWKYLLCSDGLTDMLPLETIEAILERDARDSALALFEAAMTAGGEDNISIILASVESAAEG
jgi:serine/threonine protein phosphatase PrpC